jgi:hypothetical protein
MRDWDEAMAAVFLLGLPVVLYVGWRRGRFAVAYLACVGVLLGLWGATLLAIEVDYRDADGHMDCWPSCTAFQEAVNGTFWLTLPLVALLTVVCGIVAVVSAWRRRAAHRPG